MFSLAIHSELNAVKEHDKKVTKEAQQAQEDVSASRDMTLSVFRKLL